MSDTKVNPTILTIFGITGALSRERLIPALFHLDEHGLLPKNFYITGFARSDFSHETFRAHVRPEKAGHAWKKFEKRIYYHRGDITNPDDFKNLAEFLSRLEGRGHSCANRLFYYSTLPSHYETISHELSKSGLLIGCRLHHRETRVIVEKPFGRDLKSAKELDKTLHKYFEEGQIYRIDHYLAKETVQNLLTVRFANSIYEPIWNRSYIDHVQITALEKDGIGRRGTLYEQSGALRDFVQNHMMQLLSLIAMEAPADLSTKSIRDERARVMKALKLPTSREAGQSAVLGQYESYRREDKVSKKSQTETYAALKVFVQNSRWHKVPFYLRTGKKVGVESKTTEISIHFKKPLQDLFGNKQIQPNILTFTVQPREGIYLNLMAKYPGFGIRLHPVKMALGYKSSFSGEIPDAYERLLLDFLQGDQRLFARSDEIEYSWVYIDALRSYLDKQKKGPEIYKDNAMGPKKADQLIEKDKRTWHLVQSV